MGDIDLGEHPDDDPKEPRYFGQLLHPRKYVKKEHCLIGIVKNCLNGSLMWVLSASVVEAVEAGVDAVLEQEFFVAASLAHLAAVHH